LGETDLHTLAPRPRARIKGVLKKLERPTHCSVLRATTRLVNLSPNVSRFIFNSLSGTRLFIDFEGILAHKLLFFFNLIQEWNDPN